MIYRVYLPRAVSAHSGRRRLISHTFVANPGHEQYAGRLTPAGAASLIAIARGRSGTNRIVWVPSTRPVAGSADIDTS